MERLHNENPKHIGKCCKWGIIFLIALIIILFVFMIWKMHNPKCVILDLGNLDLTQHMTDVNLI